MYNNFTLSGKSFPLSFLSSVGSLSCVTGMARQHHTSSCLRELSHMTVQILPALQDNYMYLLVDKASKEAAIVDPVNPKGVRKSAQSGSIVYYVYMCNVYL